jgi:coenzyme F420-reducing hydrogenase delta subunit
MLFNEYISALDELSIEKVETRTIKSQEFTKLEKDIKNLEKTVAKLMRDKIKDIED